MGWYHYECTDGSCDINKVVPCPDGTCPMPPGAVGGTICGATTTTTCTETTTSADDAALPQGGSNPDVSPLTQQPQQHAEQEEEDEELYEAITPIFHLCQKRLWEQALNTRQPYYPPTFWKDGRFTRASCDRDSLPMTANHYYQGVSGDWLCLELDPVQLRQLGIPIAVHREQQQQRFGNRNGPVQCLKVFGGIPTMIDNKIVMNVYAMRRDGHGYFYGMSRDNKVPKTALHDEEEAGTTPEQVMKRQATTQKDGKVSSSSSSTTWRFWLKKKSNKP